MLLQFLKNNFSKNHIIVDGSNQTAAEIEKHIQSNKHNKHMLTYIEKTKTNIEHFEWLESQCFDIDQMEKDQNQEQENKDKDKDKDKIKINYHFQNMNYLIYNNKKYLWYGCDISDENETSFVRSIKNNLLTESECIVCYEKVGKGKLCQQTCKRCNVPCCFNCINIMAEKLTSNNEVLQCPNCRVFDFV